MDELPVETRSRSRSKTPFLRSSCDREICAYAGEHNDHEHHHYHKKSPILSNKHKQIATIIEEEIVTNRLQSPLKRQTGKPTNSSLTKISSTRTTSDYSSNSSEDLSTNTDSTPTPSEIAKQIAFSNQNQKISKSTFVSTTTKVTRHITNGRQPINQHSNKSKEILQNESNSAFEQHSKIKTSTPILTVNQINKKKTKTFVENNFSGDISDPNHAGYKEYITAGEYWKKFPKTDYTYSKLSPHRRELAPGVIAFPNMSRRSLEKYNERINYMIERNPEQADSIRKRFIQTLFTKNQLNQQDQDNVNQLLYDSQDETDFNEQEKHMYIVKESVTKRFIARIISILHIITNLFSRKDQRDQSYLYRTNIHENKDGILLRSKNGITYGIYAIFSCIYLMISFVLYFDTWLLRSSNPDGKKKKRFLLLLLILLPLLLLAAWKILDEKEKNLLLSRYHTLIPFSFIGLRDSLNSFKNGLSTYNFNFDGPLLPTLQLDRDYKYATTTNDIQKSLSRQEYDNLINHINIYVQKTIDNQFSKENNKRDVKMTPEITATIVNSIQEQINLFQNSLKYVKEDAKEPYKLINEDVEKIIAQLEIKLATTKHIGPVVFTKENLDEITKLIQHNININNQQFDIIEKIQIDDLLLRILESPRLSEYIDSRILSLKSMEEVIKPKIEAGLMFENENEMMKKQEKLINELNAQISFIKANLADKLNENNNLHYSISLLQNAQNDIADRLKLHEININGRFDNLLIEIEERLANLNEKQFESINRQVKLNLIEILGYSANFNAELNLDDIDLKNWIRNMFVAKSVLEDHLNKLSFKIDTNIKEEIDKSGMLLFKDISEKLKMEILKSIELRQNDKVDTLDNSNSYNKRIGEEEIKRMVRDVLAVYDADKTGMVDYALETAGGQVLSTRCTENYHIKSAQISLFGLPLWYPSNTPRTAISPTVQPGECWAFQGFPGFLVLKLNSMIFVSGFSLEHIPKSLAPSGKIDSAPKNFTVWGLDRENDDDPVLFGEYEYSDESSPLQYFSVQNKNINRPYEIVEIKIETNHGSLTYTCLYRFRVHGKISTAQ